MTTKIITPQEVAPEMLVAGVESNETATTRRHPAFNLAAAEFTTM